MKEKLTPYLRALSGLEGIGKQYLARELDAETRYSDPLMEDSHEPVKGLVHKYGNRALIKVSYQCVAHCRFCTRIRQIGRPEGTLSEADFPAIVDYLKAHPQIDDVILSGGDPLYTPKITLGLLQQLRKIDSIKVFRIGSRLPLQSPASISSPAVLQLLEVVRELALERPFYLLLHIEHPDELTPEAITAIKMLRTFGVTLLSQSVFLKGINDNYDILYSLFRQLYHLGVMPYYIYHCDEVKGLEHFVGDVDSEREIMTRLRSTLSGIGCPTYVMDMADGYGKLPMPLNFFGEGDAVVRDFNGVVEQVLL